MSDWPLAVLFDFDGVIVNSEPVHLRAFQLAAQEVGIELSERQYYTQLIGYDDAGAWQRLLALHGRPLDRSTLERAMQTKFRLMRQLLETRQIPALPGAAELVGALVRARVPIAICSGAVRSEIDAMLAGVGLAQHFGVITSAEDVAVGKPDPSCYLLTARRVSEMIGRPLRPQECLVIEDAPAVAQAVRTVGFKSLAVATSYPPQQLAGAADWVVPSLRREDLLSAVPQLRRVLDSDLE